MNVINIVGKVNRQPYITHYHGEEAFYLLEIAVERTSGTIDYIQCNVSSRLMPKHLTINDYVLIEGEIRERPQNGHLDTYVSVNNMRYSDEKQHCNMVFLHGFLVGMERMKVTDLTKRRLVEATIASNRETSNKSDYLHCLFWNGDAFRIAKLSKGAELELVGRLQSRVHPVHNSEDITERTVYEISVSRFEEITHEDKRNNDTELQRM